MKKNKSSKSWIINQHRDKYFKLSKVSGYRSRSAFKLIELNKKYKFIKKNSYLLDLGSSPGGWSQVASEIISSGKILSVDIKDMSPIKGVKFYKLDFDKEESRFKILSFFNKKIDVLVSDMATNTTGNKSLDSIRTNLLALEVINFSTEIVKVDGNVLLKVFMGDEFDNLKNEAKKKFKKVNFFKPDSSRGASRETYIHCAGIKSL